MNSHEIHMNTKCLCDTFNRKSSKLSNLNFLLEIVPMSSKQISYLLEEMEQEGNVPLMSKFYINRIKTGILSNTLFPSSFFPFLSCTILTCHTIFFCFSHVLFLILIRKGAQ